MRSAADRYKWVALSNTTLGMLMATINSSILLIALPDIFRGIHIDPLAPGNTSYLLWMILGFLVVMAVLVVSLGRLGDIYGRVRMFNLGFAVFTLVLDPALGHLDARHATAALWLIVMRIGQGVGGALLFANSSAILTDAFPHRPARPGARHQQRSPRSPARSSAWCSAACWRPIVVAAGVPRLGADRPARHGLGLPHAARASASAGRRGSTGGATPPSRSAWSA